MSEARSYLSCLFGAPPSLPAARGEAGRGRLLALRGGGARALKLLDRAVGLAPSAEALTWRAEARLLCGQDEGARQDLERAEELDPRWPWARLLRAVCLLKEGQALKARRELSAAGRDPRARDAARAVTALADAQEGRRDSGIAKLDGILRVVARRKPRAEGFVWAVRGMLKRDAGDLEGALEDFSRALELEASLWVLSQRADALNRRGFYREALDDARRAARLSPSSPEPRLQAANILFDQAFYPEALAELQAATRLAPRDPSLLARRARFLLVLGRLRESEADMARVERLSPGSVQTRFERLFARVLRGAASAADAAGLPAPYGDYLEGFRLSRRGARKEAAARFARAARDADGGLAERARFYSLVCRVLSREGPARGRRPMISLCGIGIRHPYQITLEALRALAASTTIFNNLGDPQVSEFLGLFPARVSAVARVMGEPALGRAKRVAASLSRGKAAAFATRIHPFIYRRIANDLVTACRARGASFEGFSGVSLTEVAWGLASASPGSTLSAGAARVFDVSFLVERPSLMEPRLPAIIYCIAGDQTRARLCALLRERYPAPHKVYLLAGSGDREREAVELTISAVEGPLLEADSGAVLCVPAAKEKRA